MKVCNFIKNHSVFSVIVIMIISMYISTIPIKSLFENSAGYPDAMLYEGIILQGILVLLCCAFLKILGNNKDLGLRFENKVKDIYVIWPLALLMIMNVMGNMSQIGSINAKFSSVILYILLFVVTALLEEFLLRGAALKVFINRYGKNKKSIIKAVFVSNIVFGFSHYNLYLSGQVDFITTSVQIINLICMGVLYCAVFLRTKSIWINVILHSLIEICGNVQIFKITSLQELNAMMTGTTMTMEMAMQVIGISAPFLICGMIFLRGMKDFK